MPGLRFNQIKSETDSIGQAFDKEGKLVDRLFSIGKVAGVGSGRYHAYDALEGTFFCGCFFPD